MSAGVAVGRPLAESILREASPGQLERAAIRARQRYAAAPMRAGEERAFQAVIGQMPQAAGRMLLEVFEAGASDPTARPGAKITHQARR